MVCKALLALTDLPGLKIGPSSTIEGRGRLERAIGRLLIQEWAARPAT